MPIQITCRLLENRAEFWRPRWERGDEVIEKLAE